MGDRLADCIATLKCLGYSVTIMEVPWIQSISIRLSKNGMNNQRYIPLNDISNSVLGLETIEIDALMAMRKELDEMD